MSERRRVVITGMGALTPLGLTLAETWDGLLAGRSGVGPITQFDASMLSVRIAGELKGFDPRRYINPKEARRMARSGSSLRVERACMAMNPMMRAGWTNASTPPQSITSAAPRRMTSAASPMACVPVAQAETTVLIGPRAPAQRLTW